jgi:hypothetical protein
VLKCLQYVTWAFENTLFEDTSGIENKLILCVNTKIKDLSCSSSVRKSWIYSRCENKNISSNSTAVVQQYSCGATA